LSFSSVPDQAVWCCGQVVHAPRAGSRRCRTLDHRWPVQVGGRSRPPIAAMSRVAAVKYCPAPPFTSSRSFCSRPRSVAFHVGGQTDHCSLSIRSTISQRSLAGSWDLVLRLAEDHPSIRAACQVLEGLAVVAFTTAFQFSTTLNRRSRRRRFASVGDGGIETSMDLIMVVFQVWPVRRLDSHTKRSVWVAEEIRSRV